MKNNCTSSCHFENLKKESSSHKAFYEKELKKASLKCNELGFSSVTTEMSKLIYFSLNSYTDLLYKSLNPLQAKRALCCIRLGLNLFIKNIMKNKG